MRGGDDAAIERLGRAQDAFELAGGYAVDERIGAVLHGLDYDRKDTGALGAIDTKICGGPDIWNA